MPSYLFEMLALKSDLIHAARALLKTKSFTAVCVISLGLGMGVVIAIMVLTNALFRTPPHVDDDGLVELVIRPQGAQLAKAGSDIVDAWSYPDYLDVRGATGAMRLTGWSEGEGWLRLPDESGTIALPAMYVSSNYFATLGVTLQRGAGFTAADDASQAPAEAVISHRIWQLRFGSDPNIIGRTIVVNQTEYTVAGVAPARFRGHLNGLDEKRIQLFLPLSRHPRLSGSENARLARDVSWVRLVARLPGDVSLAQADAMMKSAMTSLAARYPSTHQEKVGGAEPYFPGGARVRTQMFFARLTMFSLAGIVLLVVGLNLSGMMLVRSAMRERELAVRLAMGASRWRLIRHHLSEAFVLAVTGGALASAVLFGVPVVIAWWFGYSGEMLETFAPSVSLVLQCIALCFVTALVLGLLPALRFSRPMILSALKNDSKGSGRRVGRLQRLTAAAQTGIAVPFLVIGGIKLDQARVAAVADVGFQPQGLYAAPLDLQAHGKTSDERERFVRVVEQNLKQAPAISSVTLGDGMPLDFTYRNGRVSRQGESIFLTAHTTRIGTGYLETLGIRLLAGRTIQPADIAGAERVVLLSQPLAQELFPSRNPVGERVAVSLADEEAQTHTVVGVTADVVTTQMGNPRPQLFVPLAQNPSTRMFFIARATADDASMRRVFEAAIIDADPKFVLRDFLTGPELIQNSHEDLLTQSMVGGIAAGIALILAALGVYGVIAFMVTIRTREIGVRVALGASRMRVLRDVLGNALMLVVPGIGVGLLLAVVWVRKLDPSWYPLGGVEPLIYATAAAIAFMVAALSGIPSARRAASVPPIVAMKAE